nr:MAG TPA: regulatory protein [Ackermannviridae sp.]
MIDKNFELTIVVSEQTGKYVADSRIIAKELGVTHKHLLEKIDGYVDKFTKAESLALVKTYFIEDTYKVENNFKKYKMYWITRKGVALLLGGYNASVPIAFQLNVAYIEKFDKMENFINQNYKEEFNKFIETSPTILEMKNKIENQIRIDYGQQRAIQKQINNKIELEYNGFLLVNSKSKRSWFMALYKGIKDKFQVASYRDLKLKDFDECVEFINDWLPPKYLFEE